MTDTRITRELCETKEASFRPAGEDAQFLLLERIATAGAWRNPADKPVGVRALALASSSIGGFDALVRAIVMQVCLILGDVAIGLDTHAARLAH